MQYSQKESGRGGETRHRVEKPASLLFKTGKVSSIRGMDMFLVRLAHPRALKSLRERMRATYFIWAANQEDSKGFKV
eukprot:6453130-Amphidinium_carterae.1